MTDRKHLKSHVRARMARTGERYAAARAHVVGATDAAEPPDPSATRPGNNPAAAALRILLTDAGLPLSESHALVIGGGIGIGVFQFHYAAEGVSTFFIAGRHKWDDDLAFLDGALRRLGLTPTVSEATSAKAADRQLRDALTTLRPVVAWVDIAVLGTRAYPVEWEGGGYHVVVVRSIDDARGVVVIDDLAAVPIEVPLEVFARARARIAKQRNRLLWLGADAGEIAGPEIVRDAELAGLRAMLDGFDHPRSRQFSLAALTDWSVRLRGAGKDSWATIFPPGEWLWSGLASVHEYIRAHGTGGGLLRTVFGSGLVEAGAARGDERLVDLGRQYGAPAEEPSLAGAWDAVARTALPETIAAFDRTRELQHARATAYRMRGNDALPELQAGWQELAAIRESMRHAFPLTASQTRDLLSDLAERVEAVATRELDALQAFRAVTG